MRLKRLELCDVRCFRGQHVFDFGDPATGIPHERLVLVGSNGSGKTTLLEMVAALLDFGATWHRADVLHDIGLAALTVEWGPGDPGWESFGQSHVTGPADPLLGVRSMLDGVVIGNLQPSPAPPVPSTETLDITFACGLEEHVRPVISRCAEYRAESDRSAAEEPLLGASKLAQAIIPAVGAMRKGTLPMAAGYIFLPSDRVLGPRDAGPIVAPEPDDRWGVRVDSTDEWQGSIEQHWVWLNYLDLERAQRRESAENLPGSIDLLQRALGRGRSVAVREGRVRVTLPWSTENGRPAEVRLDQLPSGERQCAILFGEIARRRRRGAVLLIDEPEISLHATLQRHLVGALRELSRDLDLQVILATHSQEIVRAVRSTEVISLDYPDYRFPGLEAADGSGESQL